MFDYSATDDRNSLHPYLYARGNCVGLLNCPRERCSCPGKTLFDFSCATNVAWQIVNDDVMGGVSTSRFEVTNGLAMFGGEVSLENNGGFASVRSSPARQNLAGLDAFVVRLRGDGRRYKFTVRTKPVSTRRSTSAPSRPNAVNGRNTGWPSRFSCRACVGAC